MASIDIIVYKGSPSGHVRESRRENRPLLGKEVLVQITHSGVCGTDEHYKSQDMVLGHEGIGIAINIGPEVKSIRSGDRIGWGYCHGSCGICWACCSGQNLYCDERQLYGFTNLDQGSFASHAIWNEQSLFQIPETIESAHAAPLMCAGAAVYSAIQRASVRSTDRVGILGIGGLGHLAIQFAAKMGCNVVVFSNSPDKRNEALSYGAHEFYDINSLAKMRTEGTVQCLLVTAAKQPDWANVIPWIRRGGTISAMTVDPSELKLPYMDLVMNAIQIQGSLPAPYQMHREMLAFAALHSIRPTIELFPLNGEGVTAAMEKLRQGRVRYRAVLERT
ncbi:alcohol dehydrogenase zinc-binding domain protein [Ilyonectria robusta]|uniref:alcohol dehydrogenase zinc-binding domain protein n=1 Tax=Ilyonectria robusta TaxID=1079257 RepID=UPI001E8D44B7|nr:alcohol dehydrogenase zinc-binding domain protein [Ilyonectria robusta]KAH8650748.1 alcohol dehydrogenase zinc-binding domain protein [Ilyonectria robusta]